METGRLIKTIEDIKADEAKFGLQARFQNIANYLSQNNPDALNLERDVLKNDLATSLLANYVQSDFRILDQLGVRGLFGEESYQNLESILSSQAHETQKKLNNFVKEREDSLKKLEGARVALADFDLKARELTGDQYEIGFSFPIDYQNVRELEGVLKDINALLSEIASAKEGPADFKISYVNNGSIEIYIQASLTLAQDFNVLLDHALKIYGILELLRATRSSFDRFTQERKEIMEKQVKEQEKDEIESLSGSLVTDLGISNIEIQSRIKVHFGKFLEHLEKGVSTEVRTPHMDPPPEPAEDADPTERERLKLLKDTYVVKKEIDIRNKEIFRLQQRNFDGLKTKLLRDGSEEGT